MEEPTIDMWRALIDFRSRYGRYWKQALSFKWMNGGDEFERYSSLLRAVRNQLGPSWLYRLKPAALNAAERRLGLLDRLPVMCATGHPETGEPILLKRGETGYSGLITCGHCGCAVVAQMQKNKYIYYRCSGFRGRCPDSFVREEVLSERFAEHLKRLRIDDEIFRLIERALKESYLDLSQERLELIARLREEADRLQRRLDALYVDHLDGRITPDMHDRMAAMWREERERCQHQINVLHSAEDALIDDGIVLLDLARKLYTSSGAQPSEMKNSALDLLLSNCSWGR